MLRDKDRSQLRVQTNTYKTNTDDDNLVTTPSNLNDHERKLTSIRNISKGEVGNNSTLPDSILPYSTIERNENSSINKKYLKTNKFRNSGLVENKESIEEKQQRGSNIDR